MATLSDEQQKTIINAIDKSPLSMRGAAEIAGIPYGTFISRAKKMGVYNPNPNHKGRSIPTKGPTGLDWKLVLVENSTSSRKTAKAKVIQHELLDHTKCDECGIGEWNGKVLNLHLDHINGVNNDHRLENLRFLCPNCHSQTDTYCRGSKKTK